MADGKGGKVVDVAYRFHSYPTVMGYLRDDGTCIGEREIVAMVRRMVGEKNPPCEIHLTLQTRG